MQLRAKLIVADDNLRVLEGILNLIPVAPSIATSPVLQSPADGLSPALPGDNLQISVELVVIRRQLLDAIANISKSGVVETQGRRIDALGAVMPDLANPKLTHREKEVLLLIAGGMATKEVAYALDISPKTVDFHRDNIKKKTGLRSAAHLTRYAMEHGWA